MARNPKLTLDVELGSIDQSQVDAIKKQLSSALHEVRVDPKWVENEQKLVDLQKQLNESKKESKKLDKEIDSGKESRIKSITQMKKLQESRSSIESKLRKMEIEGANKINSLTEQLKLKREKLQEDNIKLQKSQTKLVEMQEQGIENEKEVEKIKREEERTAKDLLSFQKMQADLVLLTEKQEENRKAVLNDINDIDEKIVKTNEEEKSASEKILALNSEKRKGLQNIKSINDNITDAQRSMLNLENKRLSAQHAIAQTILDQDGKYKKLVKESDTLSKMEKQRHLMGIELTQEESTKLRSLNEAIEAKQASAVDQAKKMVPMSKEQSKFESKYLGVVENTKKQKQVMYKDAMKQLKLQKTLLKQEGVGKTEIKKFAKEEQAEILKRFGLSKKTKQAEAGIAGKAAEKALGATKGQGQEIMHLVKSLAGPLLALGGIAGFVMTMLNYNKKVMEARKNMFKFAAESGMAWKSVEKHQKIGIGTLEGYRSTLRTLWDQVGMKYDDAVKAVGTLTSAGIKFEDVMKNNAKTIASVESMSTMAGMSFENMAEISGEWVTEFRKDTSKLEGTFVNLMHSAGKTDMTTSRFFSSVMNAAQGLAIYGNRVEDVGAAFADLTRGVKMPQKQATKLATTLLDSVNNMTSAQKTMIATQGGARDILAQEVKELEELNKKGKASVEQRERLTELTKLLNTEQLDPGRIAALEKELETINSVSNKSDQQKARIKEISELLGQQRNVLNSSVRIVEAMNPGQRIKMQLSALAKSAPQIFKGVNIFDPSQLASVLSKNRAELEEIAPTFGIPKETLRLVEDLSKQGTSFEDIGKEMTKSQEKALEKQMKEQTHIIELGTRPILDTLEEKIGKFLEDIYLWLESIMVPFIQKHAIPFFKMVAKWINPDYEKKEAVADEISVRIEELKKKKEEAEKTIKELEPKSKSGKITPEETERLKSAKINKATLSGRIDTLQKTEESTREARSGLIGSALGKIGVPTEEKMAKREAETTLGSDKLLDFESKIRDLDGDTKEAAKWLKNYYYRNMDAITSLGKSERSKQERDDVVTPWAFLTSDKNVKDKFPEANWSELEKIVKETLGFKKGGYTGSGQKNDIAGVVHKREFVFDADTTQKAGSANLEQLMSAIKSDRIGKKFKEFTPVIEPEIKLPRISANIDIDKIEKQLNDLKSVTPEIFANINISNLDTLKNTIDKYKNEIASVSVKVGLNKKDIENIQTNLDFIIKNKKIEIIPEVKPTVFKPEIKPEIKPVVKQPIIDPVVKQSVIDPEVKQPIVDPIVKQSIVDPVVKQPLIDPIIKKTVIDQPTVNPIVESIVKQPELKNDSIAGFSEIAALMREQFKNLIIEKGAIAEPVLQERTIDLSAIKSTISDLITNIPEEINPYEVVKSAIESANIGSAKLIASIDNLSSKMNSTMTNTKTSALQTVNHNSVVIQVNQRDKQEIEQIIYKVLYDKKGSDMIS